MQMALAHKFVQMGRMMSTRSPAFSFIGLLMLSSVAFAAGKPHEHGIVKLDVAIDGPQVTMTLSAPLDSLLGFERTPRTEAERRAAAGVLAQLRSPREVAAFFAMDDAARCALTKAEVSAPALEPGVRSSVPSGPSEHADLDATYVFVCAQPAQLRSLQMGLFDGYKRIQRIDVQVAGPKGQTKVTLKRPARSITLSR